MFGASWVVGDAGGQRLGVTRQALSELVNERAGVSVEMAVRLSKAFGSTPETWLGMQTAHDLWQARERTALLEVERFAPGMGGTVALGEAPP